IAIIAVGTLIYLPFVLVANRAYVLEQKAAGKLETEAVTNGEA
ncbi:hypothetical protein NT05LI_0068a, partial [Listeria ivanovii FSL F6-596]